MFPKKKILNFKNYLRKHQSFYLIFSEEETSKLRVEQVLYYLFHDPETETQFPYIQYVDKSQEIVRFEDMVSQNSYYVHISLGSNKCFNYDEEHAVESLKSNKITVLKEDEFIKAMDMSNVLALKERISALEEAMEENTDKVDRKYKEIIGEMIEYREKLENQNGFYKEKNVTLEAIEKEARMIADQFEKTRVLVEKNIFLYRKK